VAKDQPPRFFSGSFRGGPCLLSAFLPAGAALVLGSVPAWQQLLQRTPCLKVKGELDAPRWSEATGGGATHEILRTCFVGDESGEPMQRVFGDAIDVRLPLMDLQNLDLNERRRGAKDHSEQGKRGF